MKATQGNKLKVIIAGGFIAGLISLSSSQSAAFPPFVAKARKFGAKDCQFCHVSPAGGSPFNTRGNWLIKEKSNRKANTIDPEWLAHHTAAKKSSKK
ncbi:MAG TPA: hypothetical protein VFZ34_23865 [Blastocatellia bacterium]|nr:hypothetical protein [Blastocatellia bacterium]